MSENEPGVRRGQILWPNGNINFNEVVRAAQLEADAAVGEGERAVDLQVRGGVAQKGNDAVMVFPYSYQVLGPGGSVAARAT
jgi:hypothetical protein